MEIHKLIIVQVKLITIQGKTIEELKTNSKSDIENLTKELENEWKTLSGEIATFDSYKTNKEKTFAQDTFKKD